MAWLSMNAMNIVGLEKGQPLNVLNNLWQPFESFFN